MPIMMLFSPGGSKTYTTTVQVYDFTYDTAGKCYALIWIPCTERWEIVPINDLKPISDSRKSLNEVIT